MRAVVCAVPVACDTDKTKVLPHMQELDRQRHYQIGATRRTTLWGYGKLQPRRQANQQ
jgi:hypothetical protein